MRQALGAAALGAALLFTSGSAVAQMRDNQDKKLECKDRGDSDRFCAMKEETLPASAKLEVNAGPNGGISIKGWLKPQILMRAKIEAQGGSESEARDIASQVKISTAGGRIKADGPRSMLGRQNWSVTYEIFVPQRTDLAASTTNGGVSISDVKGDMQLDTTNGGINLARLAGKVKGTTTNGGVHIELEGSRWDGDSLEVGTTNGGVSIAMQEGYSARFEAETTHGGLTADIPGASVSKGWIGRSLSATSGSGGALIKVKTTNGGVRIGKASVVRAKRSEI